MEVKGYICRKKKWGKRGFFLKMVLVSAILCLGICFADILSYQVAATAMAATKNRITCSVKKGTLTISGKGALTSKVRVADKKKIKKIIVKKGITSLPVRAFSGYKNVKEIEISASVRKIGEGALPDSKVLKKVTIPGSYQYVEKRYADYYPNSIIPDPDTRVETICFNTQLSLETLRLVKSDQLVVSQKDRKYKSIHGVIYSKDGKSLVRVPAYRKSLTVEEGCEEFCTQAIEYGKQQGYVDNELNEVLICSDLKKIVLPDSIRTVNEKKYELYPSLPTKVGEVITSGRLGSDPITMILHRFPEIRQEDFLKQFSDVSEENGMYIHHPEHCLVRYAGNAEEVAVPHGITKIGNYSFCGCKIKRIRLPDSVTYIGDGAFSNAVSLTDVPIPDTVRNMGHSVFASCDKLQAVRLPDGLCEVPDHTFSSCSSLEEARLPDSVVTIGAYAFEHTKVPPSILFQGNIKTIKNRAFEDVDWEECVIPETVETVQEGAFWSISRLKKVTFCGSVEKIHEDAFDGLSKMGGDNQKMVYVYKAGIRGWRTDTNLEAVSSSWVRFDWRKIEGVDGWQIQVSRDKAFRKEKKTFHVKKEKTSMRIRNKKKSVKYIRIRPYQITGGKRVYGMWCWEKV